MTVRTRFAPSPTGRLHLGNVRTAVFNWLFARHHRGAFVLRIEDTDVERNVEGSEALLMEDLRWLGLEWDEGPDVGGSYGPYRQSERSDLYEAHVARLLDGGVAYRCFCGRAHGESDDRRYTGTCRALDPDEAASRARGGEPCVVRLRTPSAGEIRIEDAVRGEISFPAADIDDFVLRRSDGRVTYNFAVVVDDVTMAISHVIRGAGHLSNTPKQVLLFDALGAPRPTFVHLPNVLAPDGGKLSKRRGAPGIGELRERGVLPEAVVNYLSLLGWSHPEEREILSLEDLIATVDLDRIRPSEMTYDPDKLEWVAAQHFAALSTAAVVAGVRERMPPGELPVEGAALDALVETLRTRLAAFGDFGDHLGLAFPRDAMEWDLLRKEIAGEPAARGVVKAARDVLADVDAWDREVLKVAFRDVGQSVQAKGPALYHPLRKALFAASSGPDLAGLTEAIGREEALRRLDAALGAGSG
ncbi:MAG TPA: glutamate--tRNA ligase [Longimicrobiales bacterium]|nr:glutamate--tRNA ligase [Longimicrobiales bacterium]